MIVVTLMEKIPKYIPVRNDLIVKNKYEIDDTRINIILNYISPKKCRAIIYRLYYTTSNIQFKIYSIDEYYYQDIIIKDENIKEIIIDITQNFKLEPLIYKDQLIPKRIIQTFYKDEYITEYHYKAIQTLIKLNPEYEYHYLNDYDCRQFIIDNYDEDILYAYDKICIDAFRADLFRYCYLYKNGGCYLDHKVVLKMPIRDVIKPEDENVYCIDREVFNKPAIYISIMFTIPKAKEIYNTIITIVNYVKNKYEPKNWLKLTGPSLFYEYAYDKNISLQHVDNMPKSQVILKDTKKVFFNTNYYGYIKEKNKIYNDITIFYFLNYRKIDNTVIQVYPHSFPYTFEFKFIKSEENDDNIKDKLLLIERTDGHEGWDLDLKIKINEKTYHIGPSQSANFQLQLQLIMHI